MKAAWLEDGLIKLVDRPDPEPGPGQAVVKVDLAGICRTDLELAAGYYNFKGTPGHEFAGRVISSPDDPTWLNRRVVAAINSGCGRCRFCQSGLERHCPDRLALGIKGWAGALAEMVRIPLANLYPVPDSVADREAVFTEPLAAALRIADQIDLGRHDRLAVLGDGKLGLLIALALKDLHPELILFGRHKTKLDLARRQGVTVKLVGDDFPWSKQDKFNLVVEATGRPNGLSLALELVNPLGTVVVKSTTAKPTPVDLSRLVVNEINLIGSRCGDMARGLAALEANRLDPIPLIEAEYPLDQIDQAMAQAGRPGALKVLVRP